MSENIRMNIERLRAAASLKSSTVVYNEKRGENQLQVRLQAPKLDNASKKMNGVDVMLVLDVSGSMGVGVRPAIDELKRTTIELIRMLRSGVDRVGIVFFSNRLVTSDTMLQDKTDAMDRNDSPFLTAIKNVSAGGATFLHAALREAHDQLVTRGKNKNKLIIVMTDGDVNEQIDELKPFRTVKGQNICRSKFSYWVVSSNGSQTATDEFITAADRAERDRYFRDEIISDIQDAGIVVRAVPLYSSENGAPDWDFMKDILDTTHRPMNVEAQICDDVGAGMSAAFKAMFETQVDTVCSDVRITLTPTPAVQNLVVEKAEATIGQGGIFCEVKRSGDTYVVENMRSGEEIIVYFTVGYDKKDPGDACTFQKLLCFVNVSYTDAGGAKQDLEKMPVKISFTRNRGSSDEDAELEGYSASMTNSTVAMSVFQQTAYVLNTVTRGEKLSEKDLAVFVSSLEAAKSSQLVAAMPDAQRVPLLDLVDKTIDSAKKGGEKLTPAFMRELDRYLATLSGRAN